MFKLIAFSVLLFSSISFAFPLPRGPIQWNQLDFDLNSQSNYEGIVSLSNCSGSLVQLDGFSDSSKALVLTNGHCLESGFTAPGKYISNKSSQRRFNLFNAQQIVVGSLTAEKILYSTMTGTDITLYQTKESYQEIMQKWNVRPLRLSNNHPQVRDPITIISGYWKKTYNCSIEAFIPELREAGYSFKDSVRFDRPGCETIGGTSGSPIIHANTREVIAINNTGNEDGEKCTMNNPCEVDSNGNVSFTQGYSYGQQTFELYGCFNQNNQFDLNLPSCQLTH